MPLFQRSNQSGVQNCLHRGCRICSVAKFCLNLAFTLMQAHVNIIISGIYLVGFIVFCRKIMNPTQLWILLIITAALPFCYAQVDERPVILPAPVRGIDCICDYNANPCRCNFEVEHLLTMIYQEDGKTYLVEPFEGQLRLKANHYILNSSQAEQVITADGEGSRLVIGINGKFPGPLIDAYENQEIEITVVNRFHTDSVTIHFHGLHQVGRPSMDGVAFVSQCPILPGQTFVYKIRASPPGTSYYHAHIGDQRSMGLYGPIVIRIPQSADQFFGDIIITLQDWNHDMDSETAYQRMITEQFDSVGNVLPPTFSVDNAEFTRFAFHSGLVNGKGRYWPTKYSHNGAPLERFIVRKEQKFRYRIIGAQTLYPMRVFIQGQTLSLRTSDCYNLKPIEVQSIIVHPGERYDFTFSFSSASRKEYLLIAETIETRDSHNSYHAAEAVIEIEDFEGTRNDNPENDQTEVCSVGAKCAVFNCPYGSPGTNFQNCLNFNNVTNTEPNRDSSIIMNIDEEYFFNFGFPGKSYTPGSVNGREFVSPVSPVLTQPGSLKTKCGENDCTNDICKCTYIVDLPKNKVIQLIFTNLGTGSGWSHPVHLHGHTFFVMKMGFGAYDETNGRLINDTTDIMCTDLNNFCTDMRWTDSSWIGGNIPGLSNDPPQKDTIVVPTGGYVVVRIVTNNPGMWFLHCHIDLHNTNGMAMVINSGPGSHPATPVGFPRCGNFLDDGISDD
ncbi:ASO-like protein, partial [Mya arenaria]